MSESIVQIGSDHRCFVLDMILWIEDYLRTMEMLCSWNSIFTGKCITTFATSPLVNKRAAWPCMTQQDSFPHIILLVLKLNLWTHHNFPAEWGHISNYLFNSQTPHLDSASQTDVYMQPIHAVSSLAIVHALSLQQSLPRGCVNACRLVHDRCGFHEDWNGKKTNTPIPSVLCQYHSYIRLASWWGLQAGCP